MEYSKSVDDIMSGFKEPCKHEACDIQKCLRVHHYQEMLCQEVIDAMKHCCGKHPSSSVSCSGFKKPLEHEKMAARVEPFSA